MVEGSGNTHMELSDNEDEISTSLTNQGVMVLIQRLHQIQIMAHGKHCFPNFNKI
jgi:hypothetical protein